MRLIWNVDYILAPSVVFLDAVYSTLVNKLNSTHLEGRTTSVDHGCVAIVSQNLILVS